MLKTPQNYMDPYFFEFRNHVFYVLKTTQNYMDPYFFEFRNLLIFRLLATGFTAEYERHNNIILFFMGITSLLATWAILILLLPISFNHYNAFHILTSVHKTKLQIQTCQTQFYHLANCSDILCNVMTMNVILIQSSTL